MKCFRVFLSKLLLSGLPIVILACSNKVSYLDTNYPDRVPKKYAADLINVDGRFQQNLTMSPDGKEHLITITDSEEWRYQSILRIQKLGNKMVVDTPQFVSEFVFENHKFIGEPMIGPDNDYLYFIADYPPDLWKSKRTQTGEWSKPSRMEHISTEKDDWYPTLSKSNNLYFTNGTVYKAIPQGSNYVTKQKVHSSFNEKDTRDACISPSEDFIIFTASDSTGFGKSDLYISFRTEGIWSEAKNMGSQINTEFREFGPYISPDGKFLFFSRRDKWQNAQFSNIYWVSLDIVDALRN